MSSCQQLLEDAVKISNIFVIFDFHEVVYQHIAGEVEVFVYIHRELSRKSVGERILKIGPHLPKLLSNIKGYTFLGDTVYLCNDTMQLISVALCCDGLIPPLAHNFHDAWQPEIYYYLHSVQIN